MEVMSLLCDSKLSKKRSCRTDLYTHTERINQIVVCSYFVSLH